MAEENGSTSGPASGSEGEEQGDYQFPVIIVGAGASGIGIAHALLKGTLAPPNILILEAGDDVGSSFREWHPTTRFISPSFASHPFGPQDLNAIVPDTAVHASSKGGQHPTGLEYARYLERMMVGTSLMVALQNKIVKVERKVAESDDEQDDIVLHAASGATFTCQYLVWAAGDWSHPTRLPSSKFPKDASVHYKEAKLDELIKSVKKSDDPIVLVGFGEAGADLASALVGKGAEKIVILEKNEFDTDPNLDPSRRLSPVTEERLGRISEHVEIKWGSEVVSVKKTGKKNKVTVKNSTGETSTISTLAQVVLCTGFNVASSKLWQSMFHFKEGSPQVNEVDESTKIPNLFLAGPMLFHKLTAKACEAGAETENGIKDAEDDIEEIDVTENGKQESDNMQVSDGEGSEQVAETPDCNDNDTIIFCFIYKFRTRFAVVAGEIIRRIVHDKFMNEEGKLAEQGEEVIGNIEKMQNFYQSKGMMVTDLSCSTLACGMTTQDTPVYGYESDEEIVEIKDE